ncbi:flagellar FlbD family protein [uncultured Chryseobacterium sp.]|uniref:flagellar FlbD family protein n=1 Tax=uncultured Chryseobacterium sp. TaxID=259322 RepID=UPI0025897483|nr:flagellar FlbD family protein [uncultured Chryseobacterium sp.]
MIELLEMHGNSIELNINEIRRYRGTDLPKNGTWIEMNSGTEFRVFESFEEVDEKVEEQKRKATLTNK